MTGYREIGGITYRIVREGYRNWRIRMMQGRHLSIATWVETPSGRARHWKTKDAAERFLDQMVRKQAGTDHGL